MTITRTGQGNQCLGVCRPAPTRETAADLQRSLAVRLLSGRRLRRTLAALDRKAAKRKGGDV